MTAQFCSGGVIGVRIGVLLVALARLANGCGGDA